MDGSIVGAQADRLIELGRRFDWLGQQRQANSLHRVYVAGRGAVKIGLLQHRQGALWIAIPNQLLRLIK